MYQGRAARSVVDQVSDLVSQARPFHEPGDIDAPLHVDVVLPLEPGGVDYLAAQVERQRLDDVLHGKVEPGPAIASIPPLRQATPAGGKHRAAVLTYGVLRNRP